MSALIFESKIFNPCSDMLSIMPHTFFGTPNVMRNTWLKF